MEVPSADPVPPGMGIQPPMEPQEPPSLDGLLLGAAEEPLEEPLEQVVEEKTEGSEGMESQSDADAVSTSE